MRGGENGNARAAVQEIKHGVRVFWFKTCDEIAGHWNEKDN